MITRRENDTLLKKIVGAMNILCTDKTGTITQDRVILEQHLDIRGNENIEVLRRGFLNSFYIIFIKRGDANICAR
jgi:magnesium-transporting ATPase (P-type)